MALFWRLWKQANRTANQLAVTPEITPQADSTPIKKQHDGKRPGAGRTPNLVKRIIGHLSLVSAGQILEGVDVEGTIAEIMKPVAKTAHTGPVRINVLENLSF